MAPLTYFLPPTRRPLGDVLEQSRVLLREHGLVATMDTCQEPMAVLNAERQVVFCNEACLLAAEVAVLDAAIGKRMGELLRCVNAAKLPGGCGTSMDCRYCGLAMAVLGGQGGHEAGGECLLEREEVLDATAEYRVRVRPQPEFGEGWVSCSVVDISHEKRRQALERIFFHDILNRAGAVQGIAEMLCEYRLTVAERDELPRMLSISARALVDEIQSQRMLLAAERGELAVRTAPLGSLAALRETSEACRAFGFDEHKAIEIDPCSEEVRFETDAALLGRVLLNLLKNALEASTQGQTITTGCRREPGVICFWVHNVSMIPEAVRANVFRRSFSTKGAGRGLGTHSVRLLTEAYLRGRVEFETSLEGGTVFRVLLPI